MKRIIAILTILLTASLLIGCDKGKEDTITVKNVVKKRTEVDLYLTINNSNKNINEDSIEGILYEGDRKVTTVDVEIIEDEDENTKEYLLTFKGLKVGESYHVEVTAIYNKVRKTLAKQAFKTDERGSKENPILITTVEEFLKIDQDENAYYRLENDLDFDNLEGAYATIFPTASKEFKGELDGNNKTLKNIKIDKGTTYSGIFGRNSGVIKNLKVDNIDVKYEKTQTYSRYAGLLVGRNVGTIENVEVNGKMTLAFTTTLEVNLGGLVGTLESGGKIIDSKVNFTVEMLKPESSSSYRNNINLGGAVGKLDKSKMENVKATVDFNILNSGIANIGGLVGKTNSDDYVVMIEKAEVTAKINVETATLTATNNQEIETVVGGAVGLVLGSKFRNIYVDADIEITKPFNNKPRDVKSSSFYLGGLIGKANNLRLEESLVKGDINIIDKEERENIDQDYEKLLVGGLVGQARNSGFDKVLNQGLSITSSKVFKNSNLSILFGLEDKSTTVNYGYQNAKVIIDNQEYEEVNYLFSRDYQVNLDLGYEVENRITNHYVEALKPFKEPKVPQREGYKFIGWYYMESLFDFKMRIDKNVTLTAFWKPKEVKYYVVFDLGYQTTNEIEPLELDEAQIIEAPEEPKRDGYTFKGWYSFNQKFNFADEEIKRDTVFFARWDKDEETKEDIIVTFELGYHDDDFTGEVILEEASEISALEAPIRDGYSFVGWYLDGVLFDFDNEVKQDITIVACWFKLTETSLDKEISDSIEFFKSEWLKDKINEGLN